MSSGWRLIAMAWVPGSGSAMVAAQTLDDLFDDRVVHEVRLSINERDLRELRDRYLENVYFPADFEWRGERVRNVGVRSRGLASRSASKLGLRIDFNRYSSGQRFLGLASLVLDNLVTDPALVRERVSMAFFARLGQPAPRESFARVYINDVYEGVYAIVEPVDGDFLARALGEKSGYLFERRFRQPYYGEDLGDDPAAYRTVFEPQTHELEADAILYSPIRELFHEVNQPVDTVWRERVDRYVDLPQFVTHVAIETFLSEADGVLGYAGHGELLSVPPTGRRPAPADRVGQGSHLYGDRLVDSSARRRKPPFQPRARVQRSANAVPRRARTMCAAGRR